MQTEYAKLLAERNRVAERLSNPKRTLNVWPISVYLASYALWAIIIGMALLVVSVLRG